MPYIFFSDAFLILAFVFWSLIHLKLNVMLENKGQGLLFFPYGYPVVMILFAEKYIFHPSSFLGCIDSFLYLCLWKFFSWDLLLGTYKFIIVISSCLINLLIVFKYLSLCLFYTLLRLSFFMLIVSILSHFPAIGFQPMSF